MKQKKIVLSRVYIFFFLVALFACFVGFQIFNIQNIKNEEIAQRVKLTSAGYRPVPADRGDIYASDGSLLATSLHYYVVGMDLDSKALTDENFAEYLKPLCDSLHALLPNKESAVYQKELIDARKARKRWYKISNQLTYPEFKRLRSFPLFKLGRYKSGLVYTKEIKRKKPFKVLASRTIGSRAPYGMEGAYDHHLKGVAGEQYQRKIPGGIWIPVNDRNSVDPKDGRDVYSTIDIGIQEIVNNALKDQLIHHNADHGCAVVMESKTGKVRAIANLRVDSTGSAWEQINYAVGAATEPGSTFKLASMMALLEDGSVDLDDKINVGRGVMKFYDKRMKDSHLYKKDRVMTVREVFHESSNVGIAKMVVDEYGDNPERFVERLYGFKLQNKLGVDIHGEQAPRIKDPSQKDQWSGITLPWTSIGYEVALTPLQILAFYNAVANDGNFLRPSFVEKVCDKKEVIEEFSPKVIKSAICSKSTVADLQSLLEGVVIEGTARRGFAGTPYTVAGKTGTSQLNYWSKKAGEKTEYAASFAGYFPADDPEYTCIVVITNPRENGFYGSQVAVPVFRKISDRLYSTSSSLRRSLAKEKLNEEMPVKRGVSTDISSIARQLSIPMVEKNTTNGWVKGYYDNNLITTGGLKNTGKGAVPNVKSMTLKDAMFLLENAGLKVVIKGKGKVVEQSIQSGEKIIEGKVIEIRLS